MERTYILNYWVSDFWFDNTWCKNNGYYYSSFIQLWEWTQHSIISRIYQRRDKIGAPRALLYRAQVEMVTSENQGRAIRSCGYTSPWLQLGMWCPVAKQFLVVGGHGKSLVSVFKKRVIEISSCLWFVSLQKKRESNFLKVPIWCLLSSGHGSVMTRRTHGLGGRAGSRKMRFQEDSVLITQHAPELGNITWGFATLWRVINGWQRSSQRAYPLHVPFFTAQQSCWIKADSFHSGHSLIIMCV